MLTLDSNRDPPSLVDVFPDLLQPAIQVTAAANTCRYLPMPAMLSVNFAFTLFVLAALKSNADIARSAPNVVSVYHYAQDIDVTVLVSKKAGQFLSISMSWSTCLCASGNEPFICMLGRYRIQGSTFEGLWLFTDQLISRLYGYFAKSGSSNSTPFVMCMCFIRCECMHDHGLTPGVFGLRPYVCMQHWTASCHLATISESSMNTSR